MAGVHGFGSYVIPYANPRWQYLAYVGDVAPEKTIEDNPENLGGISQVTISGMGADITFTSTN